MNRQEPFQLAMAASSWLYTVPIAAEPRLRNANLCQAVPSLWDRDEPVVFDRDVVMDAVAGFEPITLAQTGSFALLSRTNDSPTPGMLATVKTASWPWKVLSSAGQTQAKVFLTIDDGRWDDRLQL